jgi:CHAP domain
MLACPRLALLLLAIAAGGCFAAIDPPAAEDAAPPPAPDLGAAPADAAERADLTPPYAASPDGAVSVIGCDGGAGTVGAVFWGVPVYCQPSSATGFYQCDELANRFLRDALAHPNLDNVVSQYASSMCGLAAARPEYSVWGPGFGDSSGRAPVPGDLIIWSGTPGHVAVVTSASAATVEYVQQNLGGPTSSIGWDPAAAFFESATAECWIHAEPSAPAPWPSGADCGCFDGDGDYCGLAIVDHEHWFGCAANLAAGGRAAYDTLYHCAHGVFTVETACGRCFTPDLEPATGACAE